MAHEQNAVVNQAPKELDYKAKETRYKDEGRSQEAVENTRPQNNFTNTVLVDEVKEIAHDAVEKFDKEEGGITEKELEEAIKDKATVWKFTESTVLTQAIYDAVKVGDVILFDSYRFDVDSKATGSNGGLHLITVENVIIRNRIDAAKLPWRVGDALSSDSIIEATTKTYTHNMFVSTGPNSINFTFSDANNTAFTFDKFLRSRGYIDEDHLFSAVEFGTSEIDFGIVYFYKHNDEIKMKYHGSDTFVTVTFNFEHDSVIENE